MTEFEKYAAKVLSEGIIEDYKKQFTYGGIRGLASLSEKCVFWDNSLPEYLIGIYSYITVIHEDFVKINNVTIPYGTIGTSRSILKDEIERESGCNEYDEIIITEGVNKIVKIELERLTDENW